ncbi:MAG: methylated-DNA--[protein]-cysteine S-methyltransferase [Gammaproteobacteria bacterium]|nr:methylated-DNA--[protein]-cysteine S-methyltransferase [Gammaproteobacteria bacterium]
MIEHRDYQRIALAIEFMAEHWREHPSLEKVAARVCLSEAHFTRLFTRWAGLSPKQYLRSLTLEQAKLDLHSGQDLLAASQALGLSGPGRLHDLFVDIEAVTPGQFKSGGEGVLIRHAWTDTDFGLCHVAATERGLCSVSFQDEVNAGPLQLLRADWPSASLLEDDAVSVPISRALSALAAGTKPEKLRVLVRGTNFQVQVWRALLRIPLGMTLSYGELSRELGRKSGARAVGTAVGANRIGYLIPCHRVLRAGGGLGGYRWGETRKRAMLAWESGRSDPKLTGSELT